MVDNDCSDYFDFGLAIHPNIEVAVYKDDKAKMHNKYFISDRRLLGTGSFNWSYAAVMNNHENLLISNSSKLVSDYARRFDKLWSTMMKY